MPAVRLLAVGLAWAAMAGLALAGGSTAERSPFTQGHWWEPARSGSGFDIFSAAGQVGVVWFTYDREGKPVWYTASGTVASLGTAETWPLMKHRWVGGRKQAPTAVGAIRLVVQHPEQIEVAWSIDGQGGVTTIEPLTFSGVVNEIDHSGHWFDPTNSGWGFSLQHQGDILGGALFTYDSAGEPIWLSGYARGSDTVDYAAYRGACPSCSYAAPTSTNAGRLTFEFAGESSLTLRNGLTVPMAQGVQLAGAHAVQLGRPASTRPADRQLATFATTQELKTYLEAGMTYVTPYSGASFSAAPPPTPYSPTNLQEANVDEADLVKTDGRFVYTFQHDPYGNRRPAVRVARVDDQGATISVVGSAPLTVEPDVPVTNGGLFLHDRKLIALTGTQATTYAASPWTAASAWWNGVTQVEVMDVGPLGLPVSRWRAKLDGVLLSSRRIGSRLYVVSRFAPFVAGYTYGATIEPYVSANRVLLAQTPLNDLLPRVRIDNGAATPLVNAATVHVPPQGARPPMADMIVVTAIDLDSPRVVQSLAIVGTAETVYASTTNLFVATSRQTPMFASAGLVPPEPVLYRTDLHQISFGTETMSLVGSGSIEGYLDSNPDRASFRLSEHEGLLRAVTSSTRIWGGEIQNRLTILEPSTIMPGLLKTVAFLPNAKRPESLGKPHELLYGTRFVGDRLYAVTFRVVDPLYVVDLADSADPRIAAALEVPGFSEYLHPLPNGLLLGFGKDARPATGLGDGQGALFQGLQISLFDVRDAGKPRELQRMIVGKRGSDSALLRDHHAFSALLQTDGTGTFAIPARVADGSVGAGGTGDATYYPWQWSGLTRFALTGTTAETARITALPSLVTHTAATMGNNYFPDPGSANGRSILFPKGSLYVGNGLFWHQDATGRTQSGPY